MAGSPQRDRTYLCIDLKTFYASVECADRGLDPFTTKLVVADPGRGRSTICLAVSPAMKAAGVRNRCRVFEIPDGLDYIMARPRMQRYMEVSSQIYGIYLQFVSPDDIHPYSVDECFIDATPYLGRYGVDAKGFANMLMGRVLDKTGICATAGIGPNLFLAKVALDIVAKHAEDHIGVLDEERFRREIWPHRPITDIWGIGPGIAERLAKYNVHDLMGVAALDEEILYRELGVNAEYLIDHAFGREPVTIAEIRAYRPAETSYVNGQVLPCDYTYDEAHLVLKEMVDASVLELVARGQVTDHVSLHVGYAVEHPGRAAGRRSLRGGGGGSRKLTGHTNSFSKLMERIDALWDETVDPARPIRRINVGFGNLLPEEFATYDLFCDLDAEKRERDLADAVLAVKDKFGKNALLKGMSLTPKGTARERNEQVGGHHA